MNTKEYIKVDLAAEGQTVAEYHSDAAPELIGRETVGIFSSRRMQSHIFSAINT